MSSQFEKFSERARRVLTLAQEEAISQKQSHIVPEHLLLGLVLYLVELKTGLIERRDKRYDMVLSLTPNTEKVITLAVDEARLMGHSPIEPEHLLIGLIREGEGVTAGVLKSIGVKLEEVRAKTREIIPLFQE